MILIDAIQVDFADQSFEANDNATILIQKAQLQFTNAWDDKELRI